MKKRLQLVKTVSSELLRACHYEGYGYHLMIADDSVDTIVTVTPLDPIFGVRLDYMDGTFFMRTNHVAVSDVSRLIEAIHAAEMFCREFEEHRKEFLKALPS